MATSMVSTQFHCHFSATFEGQLLYLLSLRGQGVDTKSPKELPVNACAPCPTPKGRVLGGRETHLVSKTSTRVKHAWGSRSWPSSGPGNLGGSGTCSVLQGDLSLQLEKCISDRPREASPCSNRAPPPPGSLQALQDTLSLNIPQIASPRKPGTKSRKNNHSRGYSEIFKHWD